MTTVAAGPQQACRLYRFYVWDPRTNYTTKTLGYVGETARLPFQRLMEHVQEQPWADTIVSWEVDDRVFPDKPSVLAAEEAAIHDERPIYNIEHNRGNSDRVPPWRAQEQRQARDTRGGIAPRRPAGSAPDRRPAGRPAPRRASSARPVRRRPPARRQLEPDVELPPFLLRGVLAVVMWLALAGALWWARGSAGGAQSSGVASACVVGGALLFSRKRRRRGKGKGRRR